MILILEGLDGTGKTTFASELVKRSTNGFIVNYLYFPKHGTVEETLNFWKDIFVPRLRSLYYDADLVILDRSIISTIVYHLLPNEVFDKYFTLNPYEVEIAYFTRVYDKSKLYGDYETWGNKYEEVMKYVEAKGYKVRRNPIIKDYYPQEEEVPLPLTIYSGGLLINVTLYPFFKY